MGTIFNVNEKEFHSIEKSINTSDLQDTRILITGATGFIGKWILGFLIYLNRCHKSNIILYATSRNVSKFIDQFPDGSHKSIHWIQGDVKSCDFGIDEVDYLILGATDVSNIISMDDVFNTCSASFDNESFQKIRVKKKAILLSSGAVYGRAKNQDSIFSEDDSLNVDLHENGIEYQMGKQVSELKLMRHCRELNYPFVIGRCFAFVGPHLPLDKHFAIGNFTKNGNALKIT